MKCSCASYSTRARSAPRLNRWFRPAPASLTRRPGMENRLWMARPLRVPLLAVATSRRRWISTCKSAETLDKRFVTCVGSHRDCYHPLTPFPCIQDAKQIRKAVVVLEREKAKEKERKKLEDDGLAQKRREASVTNQDCYASPPSSSHSSCAESRLKCSHSRTTGAPSELLRRRQALEMTTDHV